jgi:hypothetical protein
LPHEVSRGQSVKVCRLLVHGQGSGLIFALGGSIEGDRRHGILATLGAGNSR